MKPLLCKCGGVALRSVGATGYCKAHTKEAFADAAKRMASNKSYTKKEQ